MKQIIDITPLDECIMFEDVDRYKKFLSDLCRRYIGYVYDDITVNEMYLHISHRTRDFNHGTFGVVFEPELYLPEDSVINKIRINFRYIDVIIGGK